MALRSLLEESLPDSVFGNTDRFSWHATPVGIAALWTQGSATSPPYEQALEEGMSVGLDLSREERNFIRCVRAGAAISQLVHHTGAEPTQKGSERLSNEFN